METRKRIYNKPLLQAEAFEPNEYVAACNLTNTILEATPICAIPGTDTNCINDGLTGNIGDDDAGKVSRTHGSCGNDTGAANINGSTGKEPNGQTIFNLKIGEYTVSMCDLSKNIGSETKWSALKVNSYYKAKWESSDGSYNYEHYGLLYVNGYTNRNFS